MDDLTIISVDDHVIEHPMVWQDRVPASMRERAPRLVRVDEIDPDDTRIPTRMRAYVVDNPTGADFWSYEDLLVPISGLNAVAGVAREDYTLDPIRFDVLRPGCHDPRARVEDMDLDGILASLSFPSFPRFAGQLFSVEGRDRDLALACVQAYNDWMIDEWCGAAPGRLIPLCIMPMWDPALAVREMTRATAKGAKAFAFSENPSRLGFPSIHDRDRYWDPVFDAAEDLGVPLCIHIGSSSSSEPTAPDAPASIFVAIAPLASQTTLMDWLLSGVLLRHPRLRILLSEGGIGWIPYVLERADYSWEHQGAWTESPLDEPPSTYFEKHFYGCFIDDRHGVELLDVIGEDNVMMESDYPHSDSTWPHTQDAVRTMLEGVSADVSYKVRRGNAERVFGFLPSGIGQL